MALIHVPRPDPKRVRNPNRPLNGLLKVQIQHLHDAELNLPVGKQTEIYINAIKTEGEAAKYIRAVTEAIHNAHSMASRKRLKLMPRRKPGIDIAAAAAQPVRKRKSKLASKKRKSKK
jgi:hypothetical protein